MSDKGRRPVAFGLLLIVAIVAFVALRPDNPENKSPAPSPSSNASPGRAAPASTVGVDPATPPAGAGATDNKSGSENQSAAAARTPQFAPTRMEIRTPAMVRAGETFQATVDVGSDGGIRKLEFTVNYNKNVLQVVGSSAGTFVQHAALPAQFDAQEPSDGSVLVSFEVDNGLAVTGTGSVVVLELQALKAGQSRVTVDNITLVEAGRDRLTTLRSVPESSIQIE